MTSARDVRARRQCATRAKVTASLPGDDPVAADVVMDRGFDKCPGGVVLPPDPVEGLIPPIRRGIRWVAQRCRTSRRC